MSKKLAVKKGYTLTVTSWENDADNYQEHSMHFDSIDDAKAILRFCDDMFRSKNSPNSGGIGNYYDGDYRVAKLKVLNYIVDNPYLWKVLGIQLDLIELEGEIIRYYSLEEEDEGTYLGFIGDYYGDTNNKVIGGWIDEVIGINGELLGVQ